MTAPTIYFVRHGETDWNAEGRLQGQRDVPLNARGRRQADEVGRHLRTLLPDPREIDFVASPLARTSETMARLRAAMGLDPDLFRTDERLKELRFGRWEGQTWRDIRSQEQGLYNERRRDRWRFRPPGGESYADLTERIRPVFDGFARDAVVVSHGGVARALLTFVGDVSEAAAASFDVWQGRVLILVAGGFRWSPAMGEAAAEPGSAAV